MKRKIFIKFFSVVLASTLLVFIFGVISMSSNTQRITTERLIEETKIVALMLDSHEQFDRFKAYEGNDKFRVTIVDTSGEVLLESDTRAELENHRDREEIIAAINNTPCAVTRYSETFECEMTYYAMMVELNDGSNVILRLAIRSSELSAFLTVAMPLFIIVLIIALVLSFILSHFISVSISEKIVNVGKSLKSVNRGEYIPLIADKSEPELYSVLGEINELNESTHHHILETERQGRKLNTVLENISQGIIAINHRAEIVFVNKSATALFGCDGSTVGKELFHLIGNTELYEKMQPHLFEEYELECKQGEKYLSAVVREVAKDDIGISSIIIITDITSEKTIEKQKSEFFANASHELKTPVTVMQGLSEVLLSQDELDENTSKRIERIHKESVRLSSLISDMLKLSKLEGKPEGEAPINASISLRSIAEEVLEELRIKIAEKELSCSVCGDATVYGDPKKIYELMENLCSNAVNYNRQRGSVSVSISSTEAGTTLTVADTGIGIDKKHIPLLCQRFYRVDKSHSKKTGGTGLGLAIVKHICALYGATLNIESELDRGTVVTVSFKP